LVFVNPYAQVRKSQTTIMPSKSSKVFRLGFMMIVMNTVVIGLAWNTKLRVRA